MKKTDRKIVNLVNALKSKCQNSNNLYVAKVISTSPFKLKLYDQIITEHIYVNNSFLKTSSNAIDSNITWDMNHDYVPSSLISFIRKMFKADLLSAGDTVIVFLDGVSFYVLERVTKVA